MKSQCDCKTYEKQVCDICQGLSTPAEIEKEAERFVSDYYENPFHEPLYKLALDAFRAVHDAAIEKAAVAVEAEHKSCLPLMCESARNVRSLKLSSEAGGNE